MSVKCITWAWAQDIEARDKLVLMALADHADDEGMCWPGIKGVAEKNRISPRAVQRHIASLQAKGLLLVEARTRPDGGSTSNLYTLLIPSVSPLGVKIAPGDDAVTLNIKQSPRDDTTTKRGTTLPPSQEPPSEPSQNQQKEQFATLTAPKKRVIEVEIDESFRERMRQKYRGVLSEVDDRIDEALGHGTARKYANKQLFVQGWLRRDAERGLPWAQNGGRVNGVSRPSATANPSGVSPFAKYR